MAQELIIEPGRAERQYWRDLWHYRELFYILAWRDISVRYKQTTIGVLWALLQPLLAMAIFTVVFGRIAGLPSGGVPYPLLVLAGMLPWQFFSTALTAASNSLIGNTNLISKVYFPRMIIPASAVMTSLVDFLISFSLLAVLMIWYQFVPSWRIVTLPVFVLMGFAGAMGPGLLIAALNVKYRDFRFITAFLVQIGFFASPVGYITNVVPEKWRLLYSLNPMVGVIDGFRWAVLGGDGKICVPGFFMSLGVVVLLLVVGVRHFRNTEKSFADVI